MERSLLLVHSPLLGPSSWLPLADVARERGYSVAIPDLTGVASAAPPNWLSLVEEAAAGAVELYEPIAVVGHSGAGPFLPSLGERLSHRQPELVFVDAMVPAETGVHVAPQRLAELLDEQTEDGLLAPWLAWWPPDVVEELVPDPSDRDALLADMPRLHRSFYDQEIPMPHGWSDFRCSYLRLSAAYNDDFEAAGSRGWPTAVFAGTHLSAVTDPRAVLDALERLLAQA